MHQVSIGIQRELPWALAVEARYVGHVRARDLARHRLQPDRGQREFLPDFKRARSNGYLAQAAAGAFVPTYNATVAGSQPLTVLPSFGGGC